MRWAQLYSPHDEIRLGNQSLQEPNRSVASAARTTAQPHRDDNERANSWRAGTNWAVLLLFVVLVVVGSTRLNFSAQKLSDWKPVLVLADTAIHRGDLHYAKGLYLQAGRLSAERDDWAGLLAAACGMSKMERQRGRHSKTTALLLSAMAAAQARQSRSGLVAVANAFTALDQDKVASMVLGRAGTHWLEETSNSADVLSLDCWNRQG